MKTLSVLLVALLALSGCANVEYSQYLAAQAKNEAQASAQRSAEAVAKSNENAAKYKAMADIAATGGDSAKVAAMMAIAMGNTSSVQVAPAPVTQIAPPPQNQALQWASVLVPSITSVMGMRYNYLSTQTQSNNAASVAISTNSTMADIAGKIQAPAANMTLSGTGVLGSGTYSQANPVLSGTGVIGTGTYSTTDNHTTNPAVVVPQVTTTTTTTDKVCSVGPAPTYTVTCI